MKDGVSRLHVVVWLVFVLVLAAWPGDHCLTQLVLTSVILAYFYLNKQREYTRFMCSSSSKRDFKV